MERGALRCEHASGCIVAAAAVDAVAASRGGCVPATGIAAAKAGDGRRAICAQALLQRSQNSNGDVSGDVEQSGYGI